MSARLGLKLNPLWVTNYDFACSLEKPGLKFVCAHVCESIDSFKLGKIYLGMKKFYNSKDRIMARLLHDLGNQNTELIFDGEYYPYEHVKIKSRFSSDYTLNASILYRITPSISFTQTIEANLKATSKKQIEPKIGFRLDCLV
eukprot:TRINITY_DN8070_c0_g5_i4.p1 TRINITY_DN8070_c0_g5~~TRINITY_DN8070_c0_g5_i4.p1  ORF type:complete len:143 (+),score=11.95 TRINITY_DN8070_c0_g5_i4:467-895(+)